MSRKQATYGGEGPKEGTGPMAGSAGTHIDHQQHRRELFGQDRAEAMRGEGVEPSNPGQRMQSHIDDDEARAMYRRYWTTDATQADIARRFSRDKGTVGGILRREKHADATEGVAEELGYPEQRDWPAGAARKVEVDDG